MKMWITRATVVALVLVTGGGMVTLRATDGVRSQDSDKTQRIPASMKVTVTISRSQGSQQTASMPFALWVNTDGQRASLRMGNDIPIATVVTEEGRTSRSYSYRSLGTEITCSAIEVGTGRYKLSLNVSDSHIVKASEGVPGGENPAAVLQTFRSTNTPVLRDGESVEYVVATDTTSGESVKVAVSLEVLR